MFNRVAKFFDYIDVLALSSVVGNEHFREYRVMYYNLWKSTHCAKNKISTPSGVLIRYVEKPIGLNATAMR